MCLAIPGRVLEITGDDPLTRAGRVSFGGIIKQVNLACVPEVVPGDFVLVHVGLAITRIDEEKAREVFAALGEIGEIAISGEGGGGT